MRSTWYGIMRRFQWISTGFVVALFSSLCWSISPAQAQLGFGFGFGSFGGWGGGLFGGGWGGPGAWLNVWPGFNRSNYDDSRTETSYPSQQETIQYQPAQAIPATGILEGKITVASACPTQPHKACPLISQSASDITITATSNQASFDSNQWVSAQPNSQGYYRVSLPPGNYNVQVQNPYQTQPQPAESHPVTIQPGESVRMDMGLNAELH